MKRFDAIVVGAGLSGMRAAIELLKNDRSVAMISKCHPMRSHSVTASGGINAALGNHPDSANDSIEMHANDTLSYGYYFSEEATVKRFTNEAIDSIHEMEKWGCLFSRTKDNKIAQRNFGASTYPRTVYSKDKTGHALMNTLYEQCIRLRLNKAPLFQVFEEWEVIKLIEQQNQVAGVVAMDIHSGQFDIFSAPTVIWATGGSGRVYGKTSNPLGNSGWGLALAFREGLAFRDMEFIQFHPTQLTGSHILISEASRGEGAFLLNRHGQRFLSNYDDSKKLMELSPRDVISRNIYREILAGRGIKGNYVHLDLRHLGKEAIKENLPGIIELCRTYAKLDPSRDLIPVVPGQHYTIGGIMTDENTKTSLKGFFAAGECANNGLHGANRLGGNSLMETLVFGKAAGQSADAYLQSGKPRSVTNSYYESVLKEERGKVILLLNHTGHVRPVEIRKEMQTTMDRFAGIYRDGYGLVEAARKIMQLKKLYDNDVYVDGVECRNNYSLLDALELRGSLEIAELIIHSALKRTESCGTHFRNDFPRFSGRYRHSVAEMKRGKMKLRYQNVKSGYKRRQQAPLNDLKILP